MKKPTEQEEKILKIIWQLDSRATVNQILDAWEDEKLPLYTTVLKTLQIMEQKKLVAHKKDGRAYVYYPLISRKEISGRLINNLAANFFGNDRIAMAARLISDEKISRDEIDELKAIIEKKEKELNNE